MVPPTSKPLSIIQLVYIDSATVHHLVIQLIGNLGEFTWVVYHFATIDLILVTVHYAEKTKYYRCVYV